VRHVIVAEYLLLRTGAPNPLDHGGVVQFVGDDETVRQKTPNGGNRRLIGNEARGEDQPGLLAVQLGKFLLQLDQRMVVSGDVTRAAGAGAHAACRLDRKSTRLNSSHVKISYAVFCLKK